jgi:hypothetical protein
MLRIVYLFFVLLSSGFESFGQSDASLWTNNKKGSFYFYWGYNRSVFSKSNLHFNGPHYDFTVYNLTGSDRPSKFGTVYFNPALLSIPQYNYRLGYFITNSFLISFGMDHMKYVVDQNQMTKISGVISPEASEKYAGTYINQPIQLKEDLLMFEHTNGFNFVGFDFEFQQPFAQAFQHKILFLWDIGIGGIWIVTKTDVRVMGDGLDNDFHVAGYAMAAKTGPRFEYKKHFFLAAELKGGYATLPSVLIKNAAPEIGDHNLGFLEYYIVAGTNFRIKKQEKKD